MNKDDILIYNASNAGGIWIIQTITSTDTFSGFCSNDGQTGSFIDKNGDMWRVWISFGYTENEVRENINELMESWGVVNVSGLEVEK